MNASDDGSPRKVRLMAGRRRPREMRTGLVVPRAALLKAAAQAGERVRVRPAWIATVAAAAAQAGASVRGQAGSAGHEHRLDGHRVADVELLEHLLHVLHEGRAAGPASSPVLPVRAVCE